MGNKGNFADGVLTPPLTQGGTAPVGNPEIGTPWLAAGNLGIEHGL